MLLLGLISKDISGAEHEYINIYPPNYIFSIVLLIYLTGGGGVCRANLPTSPGKLSVGMTISSHGESVNRLG